MPVPDEATQLRIAICDDELLIGLDFEDLIIGLGHEVCAVCGSAEGIYAAVERDRPDLILMDVKLGANDGIETAARIRDLHEIPSILISGDRQALESPEAHRCRPLARLMKPISEHELEEALWDALTQLKRTG